MVTLLQVPPNVSLVSAIEAPVHTVVGPAIAAGAAGTVVTVTRLVAALDPQVFVIV